jgi:hypothetical protein
VKDKIKREYFAKLFPIFSIENLPNFEILFYFILFIFGNFCHIWRIPVNDTTSEI